MRFTLAQLSQHRDEHAIPPRSKQIFTLPHLSAVDEGTSPLELEEGLMTPSTSMKCSLLLSPILALQRRFET